MDTATQVRKIVAEMIGCTIDEVRPRTALVNDLGADSLDMVEVLLSLEESFTIDTSNYEVTRATTVQDLVDMVSVRRAA